MGGHFDIAKNKQEIEELETKLNDPDIWNDVNKAQEINKNLSALKKIDEQDNRSGIILYKKKKKKLSVINALVFLLIISIAINFTLIVLLYMMNNRITNLVSQITGG